MVISTFRGVIVMFMHCTLSSSSMSYSPRIYPRVASPQYNSESSVLYHVSRLALYKQKKGRTKRRGIKKGTTTRDKPQEHMEPIMAIKMMQRILKLTMKHPPC